MPEIFPIFMAPDQRRELIREKATKSLQNVFPMMAGRYTIHAENIRVEPEQYSPEDHKMALLQARTLTEPVKATLVLKDSEGKEIQRSKDHTVLRLPWLSPHNTFVINGNTFTLANQLRMKPSVYTRKRRDEGIEAAFNLGRGANFRLNMDPTKGTFTMDYGTTKVPLYAALGKLGMEDSEILKSWGKDLLRVNQEFVGKNADKFTQRLFNKAVPKSIQEKAENKEQALREAFDRTTLDPDVTRKTLGEAYDKVSPQALLAASKKLLKAYNEGHDFDERDSLDYKRIYGIDDFISERIGLDARNIGHKIGFKLQRGGERDLKKLMPSALFTRGVHQFITTSSLSQNPDQINPLEIIDSASKVTSLGEGGIENDRAIPLEARRLHPTHATILDPVRTPESYHAGIDLRATLFSGRDKDGNIYTQLRHPKTGKIVSVPVGKASESTVAFPDQELKGKVDAFAAGRLSSVPASSVDYVMPNVHSLYAPTTNLVPFLDSDDGMRAQMGSKFMTQAVPLVDAEQPLVQVASYRPHMTMEQEIGRMIVPRAPVAGTVTKIKDGYLYIKPKHKTAAADDHKVPIYTNFPLTSKTFLHQNLLVKPGDNVEEGDILADSHFAKDGRLTLGKNLRVAYVPLRGMDTNDAIAISESAAKKLTSLHMHQEGIDLDTDSLHNREKHRAYYGNKFNKQTYDNLDADGLVKPGTQIKKGDLLVAALKKTELSPESAMLGRLHKSLVKPFQDISLTWDRDQPGIVQDVVQTGNKIRLTVKSQEPMLLGSKLGLRHGGKGVVSAIIPDDQMIKDEQGRTIDVAISPTSVLTRLNPGQLLETALGKVAEKTGKPVVVENFAPRDNVKFVKEMLAKHNISDKETIFDPQTGKHIPGVLVGPQYVLKLFKTVDTQFSARGAGDEDYDVNLQPSKGGIAGSKSLGRMELNALLAHNARNIIREAVTTKSEKNDEFWRRYQLGLPAAPVMPTFAYDKFGAMLSGAGIKLNKQGNDLTLMPMTDRDTLKLSRGEITKPLFVRAKDMRPEKDGLFDPAITGGLNGKQYAHYSLAEPIVNPSFERPVKTLLGLTSSEFQNIIRNEGGHGIKTRLTKIDTSQRQKEVLEELHKAKPDRRDNLIKELKYLKALDANNLKPQDAYVISYIPVIPPIFRPVIPGSTGDLRVADANTVMQDVMLANETRANSSASEMPKEIQADAREHLYEAAKALYGLREPVSPRAAGRGVQGYLARIAGQTPKTGFFQSKLIRKGQDLSGRGVTVPDASLGMDEMGLPEDMGWSLYSPFVIKNLIARGYEATEAKKMLDTRHPIAQETLQREMEQRPILMNRAPTLRRYNIMAMYPRLVPGQALRTHELQAPPAGMDYDGDAMQVFVPIGQKAVEEAKKLTLTNMLLGDQYKSQLLVNLEQDARLGVHLATRETEGSKRTFKTKEEAVRAYHNGEIQLNTPVEIKK